MPVTQLSYKDWTFEVDIDSTKEWYSGIHLGEAQNCQCNSCRNILLQRDIIPPDIKQLLEKMGVDINKEIHISYWFDDDFDDVFDEESLVNRKNILDENSYVHYVSYYYRCFGKVKIDNTITNPVYDNDTLTEINDNFYLGFKNSSISHESSNQDIFEVCVQCNLAWNIKPGLEQLARHNLNLMHEAVDFRYKKTDFVTESGIRADNADELIDYLLKHDFIERDEEIIDCFTLSHSAHHCFETNLWSREMSHPKAHIQLYDETFKVKGFTNRELTIQKIIENMALPFIIFVATCVMIVVIWDESKRDRIHPTNMNKSNRTIHENDWKQFIDSLESSKR